MNSNLKLRQYQIEDVKKFTGLKAAGCFNEQRTGKTPTSLITMQRKQTDLLLIVCPPSMMYPWADSIKDWIGLEAIQCTGTPVKRLKLIDAWDTTHPLIISYDTLKATRTSKSMLEPIKKQVSKFSNTGIIIDEAHRTKGRTTATAKAIFALKNTFDHKLALTATPAHNKTYDIWPVLHFLFPNTFNSYWNFIDTYYETKEQYAQQGHKFKNIIGFKSKQHELVLQKMLESVTTRRTRKEIMPWVPDKDIRNIKIQPSHTINRLLEDLLKYYEVDNIITEGHLDRLVRLRQICLDPKLLGLGGRSPKTEWIKQYMKDYPDRSVIIFSNFTEYLKLLKELLPEAGLYIGSTSKPERDRLVKQFQNKKLKILLINIKAGSAGLTLDAGETIIFPERYPPVGDIAQAEDRFVATTEFKAEKAHTVYRLILEGTYDEELHNLVEGNASLVDVINNFQNYIHHNK